MLEVKELCKKYKPKKGVPVQALDHVSIKFPERGMVFLLGKSGSGKSTLLNLLGGLDRYDSGEILIHGESSAKFKQQQFDSYRNTYVGFIFQEYNILQEFTVGANIALAIELQNRKATDEEINRILKEVDLEGYGKRKPNELSGGQLQRVAIARALVKNPDIIMADEPTGALDSNTGRQIFDTLKKLSADKLIIIVSHDREFSEQYADRIIELADGKVISDMECVSNQIAVQEDQQSSDELQFVGDTVLVPAQYQLTEEDRLAINSYLMKMDHGVLSLKKKTMLSAEKQFRTTDESQIVSEKKGFELIRSKLPMKKAFCIGASGLKYKKVKLVFTILLSVVAFSLFALADTFGAYKHVQACVDSLMDSNVKILSMGKENKTFYGSGDDDFYWDSQYGFHKDEIQKASDDLNTVLAGIITDDIYIENNFYGELKEEDERLASIYRLNVDGAMEYDEKLFESMHIQLVAGHYPDDSKNEVMLSDFYCKNYLIYGYPNRDVSAAAAPIKSYNDLIGKTVYASEFGEEKEYVIAGVFTSQIDTERYESIYATKSYEQMSSMEQIAQFALEQELNTVKNTGIANVAIFGKGHLREYIASVGNRYRVCSAVNLYLHKIDKNGADIYVNTMEVLGQNNNQNIVWIDGTAKTELADNEVIINSNSIIGYQYYEYKEPYTEDGTYIEESTVIEPSDDPYEELTEEDLIKIIKEEYNGQMVLTVDDWRQELNNTHSETLKIVGISMDKNDTKIYLSQKTAEQYGVLSGIYSYMVGAFPTSKADVKKVVEYSLSEQNLKSGNVIRYAINNNVMYELETVNEVLQVLAKAFLYIGIFFAVFASLLLANFIANSVSYKKQEIGILRAIGSRSNDVFRIFFSESFIIAMITFAFSSVITAVIIRFINSVIRSEGIMITILHFGIRQVVFLIVINLAVVALASFIPVKKIASKKPIDAIRNR